MLMAASLIVSSGPARCIIVVLRLDDVNPSSTGFDTQFVQLLRKHNVAATFGVIPFVAAVDVHDSQTQPLLTFVPDGLEAADLIDRRQVEIAMHGFSHQAQLPAGSRKCGVKEFWLIKGLGLAGAERL